MITKWFHDVWIAFLKLWVMPPPPIPTIDPNAHCPGCGHRDGGIVCVAVAYNAPPQIMHTCKVCDAKWFSAPVNDDKRMIMATHIINPNLKAEPISAVKAPKKIEQSTAA